MVVKNQPKNNRLFNVNFLQATKIFRYIETNRTKPIEPKLGHRKCKQINY